MEILILVIIGIIGFSAAQLAPMEWLPFWGVAFALLAIIAFQAG